MTNDFSYFSTNFGFVYLCLPLWKWRIYAQFCACLLTLANSSKFKQISNELYNILTDLTNPTRNKAFTRTPSYKLEWLWSISNPACFDNLLLGFLLWHSEWIVIFVVWQCVSYLDSEGVKSCKTLPVSLGLFCRCGDDSLFVFVNKGHATFSHFKGSGKVTSCSNFQRTSLYNLNKYIQLLVKFYL